MRGSRGGAGIGCVRDELGGADGAEVESGGDFSDGLVGFGVLGECDEEAVGAEDAAFFAGDSGDGVAEVLLVVEGYVGEDGKDGLDDVGGVEGSAEAYFEDGDVDALLGEPGEGEGGEDFEEAGEMGEGSGIDKGVGSGDDVEVEAGEVFVGDLVGVDLDALVDADEMGRGVKGSAVSGGGEDAAEGCGSAALAVGSSDENGREGELRIAERRGEGAHVGELELAGRGGRCAGLRWRGDQLEAEGVEVVERSSVGHEVF